VTVRGRWRGAFEVWRSPPSFFVSVAFKGFSGGVRALDFKGEVDALGWVPNGLAGDWARVDFNAVPHAAAVALGENENSG
jgi:hypothetical protein